MSPPFSILRRDTTPTAWIILWFLTAASAPCQSYVEAEDYDAASPFAPLVVQTDALASGGEYIMYGSGSVVTTMTAATAGQAWYSFEVPADGTLTIWARTIFIDNSANSAWVKVDGLGDYQQFTYAENSRWGWRRCLTYPNVTAGTYRLMVGRRETEARFDAFYMTMGDERPIECKGLTPGQSIEAEAFLVGAAFSPLAIQGDPEALGGSYVVWPGSGGVNNDTSDAATGRARYGFGLLESADVDLWARVNAPLIDDNEFYYRLDGAAFSIADVETGATWNWVKLTTFAAVSPGLHYLEILRREDGVAIDALYVCNDGSAPYTRHFAIQAEAYENSAQRAPLAPAAELEASCGGFVSWPTTGNSDATPDDTDPGQAHYTLTLVKTGVWRIQARVNQPSADDDLFHWKLEGHNGWQSVSGVTAGYEWITLMDETVTAGSYTFKFLKGDDGMKFDALFICNDASAPPSVATTGLAPGAFFVVPPPVGNDANPGTAAAPWATPDKAAATLQPGQTVYLRGGTFVLTSTIRPAVPGNPGAWITYSGYPGERAEFDGSIHADQQQADFFNLTALGPGYTRIQSLVFRDGGRGLALGANNEVIGCEFLRLYHSAIWLSDECRVLGNYVQEVNRGGGNEGIDCGGDNAEVAYNEVCYSWKEGIDVLWGCHGTRVHHNYVHHMRDQYEDGNSGYAFGAGIYVDAAGQEDHIYIHDNVIHDCNAGISLNAEIYSQGSQNLYNVLVRNNVLSNIKYSGVSVANAGDGGRTWNCLILNNTVYGHRYSHWTNLNRGVSVNRYTSNTLVRNNLLINTSQGVYIDPSVAALTTADYNITAGAPMFVDAADGDFRLVAGSPAIDAGHPDPLYNDPDGTRNDVGALYFQQTSSTREMDVRYAEPWNFQPAITNGDLTPDPADGTDFGPQNVPFGRTDRRFRIHNAGGASLAILGVNITGAHYADFIVIEPPHFMLAPGASTDFVIGFDPTAAGLRSATIEIESEDTNENPYVFAIAGVGITGPPEIAVSFQSAEIAAGDMTPEVADGTDFGHASVAVGAVAREFVIRNQGGLDLTLNATLQGLHASDFAITTAPAAVLSGGASAVLGIAFAPGAGGVRIATVRIDSNDADENPFEFAITGLGDDCPWLQDGAGLVAFEAEACHEKHPGILSFEGFNWITVQDATASSDAHTVVPNTGNGLLTNSAGSLNAAHLDYTIAFMQTGTHYIHLRNCATTASGADDSIWFSVDGAAPVNATLRNNVDWGWTKPSATFTIAAPGEHTLTLLMRENGCKIDKIVLTTSSAYNPATVNGGLGPAESVRAQCDLGNQPPFFLSDPITKPDATEEQAYSGSLASDAADPDAGDTLTFSKVSGPAWLAVAADGALSGMPPVGAAGLNVFTVRVQDSGGLADEAALNITVKPKVPVGLSGWAVY